MAVHTHHSGANIYVLGTRRSGCKVPIDWDDQARRSHERFSAVEMLQSGGSRWSSGTKQIFDFAIGNAAPNIVQSN